MDSENSSRSEINEQSSRRYRNKRVLSTPRHLPMISPTLPQPTYANQTQERQQRSKNLTKNRRRALKQSRQPISPRTSLRIIDSFRGLSSQSQAGRHLSNGPRHQQSQPNPQFHQDDHFEHVERRHPLESAPVEVGNRPYYSNEYGGGGFYESGVYNNFHSGTRASRRGCCGQGCSDCWRSFCECADAVCSCCALIYGILECCELCGQCLECLKCLECLSALG